MGLSSAILSLKFMPTQLWNLGIKIISEIPNRKYDLRSYSWPISLCKTQHKIKRTLFLSPVAVAEVYTVSIRLACHSQSDCHWLIQLKTELIIFTKTHYTYAWYNWESNQSKWTVCQTSPFSRCPILPNFWCTFLCKVTNT